MRTGRADAGEAGGGGKGGLPDLSVNLTTIPTPPHAPPGPRLRLDTHIAPSSSNPPNPILRNQSSALDQAQLPAHDQILNRL
jgi:hypothetical protein